MTFLSTFAIAFVLALLALVLLNGYARHMGNPEGSDWRTMVVVALTAAAVVAGAVVVGWETFSLVRRLFG